MSHETHLYLILHPNHSLIASQLGPADFVRHYVQGSTRYFEGKLIFAEVDPAFRSPFFEIDKAYAELVPHEDGRPKATKFIMSYRVLENMDFEAIDKLYLGNASGDFVQLDPAPFEPKPAEEEMQIMIEINPVKFMVLTRHDFLEFSRYVTDPKNGKGAPKMFYAQLEFSVDDFMRDFEENPFIRTFVPGIHPARLKSAVLEIRRTPGKMVKGISVDCPIDKFSYKLLKTGFMFASQEKSRFYPLLPLEEVERKYYNFWKAM